MAWLEGNLKQGCLVKIYRGRRPGRREEPTVAFGICVGRHGLEPEHDIGWHFLTKDGSWFVSDFLLKSTAHFGIEVLDNEYR